MGERHRIAPDALRSAFRSVCSLGLTTGVAAILTFTTQLILARRLAVHEYGALASALALITLAAPVAGLGVGPFWLHIFGVEGWRAHRWLRASFRAILVSVTFIWTLLALFALLGSRDPLTGALVLILLPVVVGQMAVQLVHARYQLEHRFSHVSLWQLVVPTGRLLVATLASSAYHVAGGFAIWAISICCVVAAMMTKACRRGFALFGHGPGALPDAPSPPVSSVVRGAVPFALSGFLHFIYLQSDVVLVGWMIGPTAAAKYNVAFTVLMALYLVPGVVNQKYLLPQLHRWASHDPLRLRGACHFTLTVMLVAGLLAMVGLLVVVDEILPRLFGARYVDAAGLLKILAIAIPIRYLSSVLGAVLTTRQHVHRKVKLQAVTAVINVTLNCALIPRFAAEGAAIATVATEAILFGSYIFTVRNQAFLPILKTREISTGPDG